MSTTVIHEKEQIKVAEVAIESIVTMPSTGKDLHVLVGHRNKGAAIYSLASDVIQDESRIIDSFKDLRKGVKQAIYSVNGNKIISASGNSIFVTDKLTKSQSEFKGHTRTVTCVAINKENNKIVSGSQDGSIILWNTKGEIVAKFQNFENGHCGWINCIGFIPGEEDKLATGSEDGTVKIWDLTTCTLLKTFVEGALFDSERKNTSVKEFNEDRAVKSICFSTDGSIMAYGGRNGIMSIIDLGHDELLTNVTAPSKITALASSDSQPLIAMAVPNKILIYNIMEDKIISEYSFATKKEVYCYSLLFVGNEIIAGLVNGTMLRLEVLRN